MHKPYVPMAVVMSGSQHYKFAARFKTKKEFKEFTDEARHRFVEYDYGQQLKQFDSSSHSHRSIYGKSSGKVARVAGLLQLHNDLVETVGLEQLENAISLVDYADSWALTLHESGAEGDQIRLLRRVHNVARKSSSPLKISDLRKSAFKATERKNIPLQKIELFVRELQGMGIGEVTTGRANALLYRALKAFPHDL
jgi:hypothetical protein